MSVLVPPEPYMRVFRQQAEGGVLSCRGRCDVAGAIDVDPGRPHGYRVRHRDRIELVAVPSRYVTEPADQYWLTI